MIRDRDPVEIYNSFVIPSVEEVTSRGSYRYDIFSRLLKERIIFLGRSGRRSGSYALRGSDALSGSR